MPRKPFTMGTGHSWEHLFNKVSELNASANEEIMKLERENTALRKELEALKEKVRKYARKR